MGFAGAANRPKAVDAGFETIPGDTADVSGVGVAATAVEFPVTETGGVSFSATAGAVDAKGAAAGNAGGDETTGVDGKFVLGFRTAGRGVRSRSRKMTRRAVSRFESAIASTKNVRVTPVRLPEDVETAAVVWGND